MQGFVKQSVQHALLPQGQRHPATPRGQVLQRQALLEHLPARGRDPHEVRPAVGGIATTAHERQRFEPVHQAHHRVRVNRAALAQRRLALGVLLDEHGEHAELRRGQAKRGKQATELAQRVLIGLMNEKTERIGQTESGCVTRRDRHVRDLVSMRIICLRTDSLQAPLRVLSCPPRGPVISRLPRCPGTVTASESMSFHPAHGPPRSPPPVIACGKQKRPAYNEATSAGPRARFRAARSGWGGTADPHRQTHRRTFESQANEE